MKKVERFVFYITDNLILEWTVYLLQIERSTLVKQYTHTCIEHFKFKYPVSCTFKAFPISNQLIILLINVWYNVALIEWSSGPKNKTGKHINSAATDVFSFNWLDIDFLLMRIFRYKLDMAESSLKKEQRVDRQQLIRFFI